MKKQRQNQLQELEKDSIPRKRQKKQNKQQYIVIEQQNNKIFCNCYQSNKINQILSGVIAFKNYLKYISIIIRHQQKSIQSISNYIKKLSAFSQVNSRVSLCIQKAKVNFQFINVIINNYSQFIHSNIKYSDDKNSEILPNSIIHIFIQIAKQWSNLSIQVKRPMIKAIQLVKQYSKFYKNMNGEKNYLVEGPKIFVQGSGMGRIICELQSNLLPQPTSIEACEERVLYYLCGQYFLERYINNRLKEHHKIYPFIHDFTNRYKTQDSYEGVVVPEGMNLFGKQFSRIEGRGNLSVNLAKFEQQYSSNKYNNEWDIVISYLCTDNIINILKWIQIIYKILKQEGIWILIYYSSFQKNEIFITSKQFMSILENTQFTIKFNQSNNQSIIMDKGMIKEKIIVHYLVLEK